MDPDATRTLSNPTEAVADERLDRLLSVTDSALRQLSFPELLTEVLDRAREILAADTAAILLLDPTSQTLAATAARGLEEEVYQGVRIPVGRGFAGKIAATRQPVVLDRVDESTVANPILWEKGLQRLLGVPLLGQEGRLVGILHVGRLGTTAFTPADVSLLEVVAERVAGAIQSSRLAAEEHAAAILELSLMPAVLPELPEARLAARYATAERGVGGDWYDAFVLPSGSLWMVAGDVAGHGLDAAVVMGRVRSSLRSYALLGQPPERTLELTDEKVHHFEVGVMVTVLCAVAAPPYSEFRLSSAGHPPPLVAAPTGDAFYAEVAPDPPLGTTRGRTRHGTSVRVPEGGVLLLYTDGLVERPNEHIDRGLDRLRETVVVDEPDAVCRSVMHSLVGSGAPTDDIAVLALQRARGPNGRPTGGRGQASTRETGRASSRERSEPTSGGAPSSPEPDRTSSPAARSFPSDAAAIPSVRRFAVETAGEWPVDVDAVALLVTELATNAVQHAATPYTVELECDPPVVRIAVTDRGEGALNRIRPPLDLEHGRGLFLVDMLAGRWGVRGEEQGKTVWVELPAQPAEELARARKTASILRSTEDPPPRGGARSRHEGRRLADGTTFRTERDGETATVVVDGDVDIAEAEDLEQLLCDLADQGAREVVVDLESVTFMGSSGLGALIAGQNRLSARGGRLQLRSPSRNVRRVLEITALDKVMALVD